MYCTLIVLTQKLTVLYYILPVSSFIVSCMKTVQYNGNLTNSMLFTTNRSLAAASLLSS